MSSSIELSPHVQLLSLAVVRSILGRSGEDVLEMVEEGRWLRWSFDVSSGTRKTRCLRVFRGSVLAWARKEPDLSDFAVVLESILGVKRPRLRATELVVGWQVSRPHLSALMESGEITGETEAATHTTWIHRQSAADFLKRRLVGDFDPTSLKSISRGVADTAKASAGSGRALGGAAKPGAPARFYAGPVKGAKNSPQPQTGI